MDSSMIIGAVEIRAAKRRAVWELERLAQLRQQVDAGRLTKQEAKERGL